MSTGQPRIRVGLGLPQLGEHVDAAAVRTFCARAEELGYSSLWVQEHLFYPHDNSSGYAGRASTVVHPSYRSVLAALELMAFAAACTSRVTIGSSILVGGYHRPIELAQRLSTIDVLSEGRLIAGLSVGWSDEEHAQMDVDPRTRGRRLDELILALRACWGPDPVEFSGEFFSIPKSDVRPKPVQQPFPPLLSGLKSEAGLRRTAALFDIWNPTRGTPEEIREQLDKMNADRPAGAEPLRLFVRSYAQRPTDPVGQGAGHGFEGIQADLVAAIEAGAEELIVDAGFWDEMDSVEAWRELPDRFAPLLELARGN